VDSVVRLCSPILLGKALCVAKRELMVISFSDFPISGIRTISVDVCATVHGWLVG